MKWLKLKAVKNANRQATVTVTGFTLLLFCITASYGETTVTLTRQLPSEVNLSHIKRIAVIPFDNDVNSRVSNALGDRLQQTGSFELLERSRLDALMKEHEFSMSGMVDESSAAEIGQAYGVQALVLGSVNVFRVYDEETTKKIEWQEQEQYTNSKGKRKTRYVSKEAIAPATIRRGNLDITCKIVDIQSLRIMAQKTATATRENIKVVHLKAKKNQQKQLPSREAIERELLNETLTSIVKFVSPYMESVDIRIDENCKNENCKQAVKLMKMNMLDNAKEVFEAQLQKYLSSEKARKKDKGKDKKVASVYFNLGLIAEMQGDMEKALSSYTEAIVYRIKDPAKKQTRARERVGNYIQAWQAYAAMAQDE